MATRKLLIWFEARRESKTLNLAQKQLAHTIGIVNELDKSIVAFANGEKDKVDSSLQKLFSAEVEIDNLRRTIFEELVRGKITSKYREDLKGLVEHLDILADNVKDSARSVKILIDTPLQKEILDGYAGISKNLVECINALGSCIEMLGIDPFKTIELADQVDVLEDMVDDGFLREKSLFIKKSNDLDVAALMEARSLLGHLEATADLCADIADHIRTLAFEEIARTHFNI